MNHTKFCILSVIIANCILFADCNGSCTWTPTESSKESIYIHNGNEYKLVVDAIDEYNAEHIAHRLMLTYNMYKNGNLLKNKIKTSNVIKSECDLLKGGNYSIELIEESDVFGWILDSPGHCGSNSSSANTLFIFPSLNNDNYIAVEQNLKFKPYFNIHPEGLNIYYSFQEWNWGGTSSSIYVPQKLFYDKNKNIIYKQKLEITDIKNLNSMQVHFKALLMAGFTDSNTELMQYALDYEYNYTDEKHWYDSFFGCDREYDDEIDYQTKSIRLADCSRENFQNIINNLK